VDRDLDWRTIGEASQEGPCLGFAEDDMASGI